VKLEQRDLEKLAQLRAKKRVDSWSEQFKSPWMWLSILLGFAGLPILIMVWIGAFVPNSLIDLRGAIVVTLLAGAIATLLWLAQKAREEKQLRRFYEEELLELKIIKHG
jgi:hypothetical protein